MCGCGRYPDKQLHMQPCAFLTSDRILADRRKKLCGHVSESLLTSDLGPIAARVAACRDAGPIREHLRLSHRLDPGGRLSASRQPPLFAHKPLQTLTSAAAKPRYRPWGVGGTAEFSTRAHSLSRVRADRHPPPSHTHVSAIQGQSPSSYSTRASPLLGQPEGPSPQRRATTRASSLSLTHPASSSAQPPTFGLS